MPSWSSRFVFASGGVQTGNFLFDAEEDRVPGLRRQLLPRRVEGKLERAGQAVHHPAVPRVRVVAEGLTHETAAEDAPLRIGDQQVRVRQLVHAEAAARPARALGVVEHEELGRDVAVHEVVGGAAGAVQPRRVGLRRAFEHLDLEQAVTHQQRGGDAGLDRLFVPPPNDEAVDDRVHVRDLVFVERDFFRNVHRMAVHNKAPDTLLPDFRQDKIQLLAVDLEDRGAQLDLGALRQRQDRFEDLAR